MNKRREHVALKAMPPSASAAARAARLAGGCISGVGLHSGLAARVRLRPAPPGAGITFVRTDLAGEPSVAARHWAVTDTTLSTTLGEGAASVATVEHLMAALCGSNVHDCRVEVDAPELPLLDGSAEPWLRVISEAGVAQGSAGGAAPAAPVRIRAPVRVEEGASWAFALPAASARLTVGIEFERHAPIGRQWASWAADGAGSSGVGSFAEEVAPARTFALHEQIAALREAGLIRGGTLENALVCDGSRWLNGPLRFANEPARHKLLDLMGDLALLGGGLPATHVVAFRASHRLHVRLAQAIAAAAVT